MSGVVVCVLLSLLLNLYQQVIHMSGTSFEVCTLKHICHLCPFGQSTVTTLPSFTEECNFLRICMSAAEMSS